MLSRSYEKHESNLNFFEKVTLSFFITYLRYQNCKIALSFFQAMFEHELGVNVDQTVRAAVAYTKIIATVEEARQAATKAVEAAAKALEKASPLAGNLRTKADQVNF